MYLMYREECYELIETSLALPLLSLQEPAPPVPVQLFEGGFSVHLPPEEKAELWVRASPTQRQALSEPRYEWQAGERSVELQIWFDKRLLWAQVILRPVEEYAAFSGISFKRHALAADLIVERTPRLGEVKLWSALFSATFGALRELKELPKREEYTFTISPRSEQLLLVSFRGHLVTGYWLNGRGENIAPEHRALIASQLQPEPLERPPAALREAQLRWREALPEPLAHRLNRAQEGELVQLALIAALRATAPALQREALQRELLKADRRLLCPYEILQRHAPRVHEILYNDHAAHIQQRQLASDAAPWAARALALSRGQPEDRVSLIYQKLQEIDEKHEGEDYQLIAVELD